MIKLLAHPIYAGIGLVFAKLSALAGMASALKDHDIMNMDADDWFMLSALYMLFIVVSLLARLVQKSEKEE
jgi:hypothetical protein